MSYKLKQNLIADAKAAFPNKQINEAIRDYLKYRYEVDRPLSELISRYLRENTAYNFDGVDDRATLQFRAINPDGDIDIEWTQIGVSNVGATPQTIVTQSLSATIASREFVLRWNGNNGGLQLSVGGTGLALTVPCLDGKYRVTYVGSTYTVFYNGVLSSTGSFTRGTAREHTAVTLVGCRNSAGTFTEFVLGRLFDVRINGVLWPMTERNQTILLPQPSGLGPELMTQAILENPATVGSQWSHLGGGRWQLVSDGAYSGLSFISAGAQPEAGFVEFEIESISGGFIRCSEGTAGLIVNSQFNTPGIKRWYYTQKSLDNRLTFSRNNSGVPVTCVIKNISFKPLWVANAAELLTNGNFDTNTSGWFVGGTGTTITWSSGQATLNCIEGQPSRMEQQITNLEAGAYYVATASITGTTGVILARLNIIRGAAGGYVAVSNTQVGTGASQPVNVFLAPASDVMVQIVGDSTNAGTVTVDKISLRKLNSLCNPMVTSNFNPDRWSNML